MKTALRTTSLLVALTACVAAPDPLPTEVLVASADARIERASEPALYQMLYDYAFLPEVQYAEQRVRLLIWLKRMDLTPYQLNSMLDLAEWISEERGRIEDRQAEILGEYEPRLLPIYNELWRQLSAGVELDDTEMENAASALLSERVQHARQDELLGLRAEGVNNILNRVRSWLQELSPAQEIPLTDSLFLLRHRLDPYANPGDFASVIGSVFVAGDWGTLTRGIGGYTTNRDHLNIGGLWTEAALESLQGPIFNDARREIVSYMVLLEPSLPEAIQAMLSINSGDNSGTEAPSIPEGL
jgi:hypothetical protein